MVRWIASIFALGVTQAVFAQLPVQQPGGAPAGLVQKHSFVRGLMEDVALEKRVRESQDAEAQRLLASAKGSYAAALAAFDGGDFAVAEKLFGEALSAVGKVRRRVPDVAAITAGQRADYERLLGSVESLHKSYLGYLQRGKLASGGGHDGEERANLDVVKLIESARTQAKEGRLAGALQALTRAEQGMKSGIGRVLGAATLDYAQKFDKPADELAYELERNRSFLELIPVAVAELKPGEETEGIIGDLIEQNRVAIQQANKYARAKDYDEALSSVRVGNGYLQNALTVAGLLLPQQGSE